MTDRDNPGGGGMTGATGDLTPEAPDQAFDPGELREVAGPDRARGDELSEAEELETS